MAFIVKGVPAKAVAAMFGAPQNMAVMVGYVSDIKTVADLKGKKLVAAEKAIVQAHCAVGKVKKAKSSHVKKGSVISQSPSAGKSLPNGTKVGIVVSKGK